MIFNKTQEELLHDLIKIQSISGKEDGIIKFLKYLFDKEQWVNFELKSEDQNSGLLVIFGTPKILFTTHLDVVEADPILFEPKSDGIKIYGRGAVDAKGSIVSMLTACKELLASGAKDFGLFLFSGQEKGGYGAKSCIDYLKGFGIEHVIMGEPTKCRLADSQLGALSLDIKFKGFAQHSAYSNESDDANKFLIRLAQKLYSLDQSLCELNGIWSVTLGKFFGGLSPNTISPLASMEVYIRTSQNNHDEIITLVKSLAPGAEIKINFSSPAKNLTTLDGFEITKARMCSALHYFEPLSKSLLMMGPGDPKCAHSKNECIDISELYKAKDLYQELYYQLRLISTKDYSYVNDNDKSFMDWYL